MRVIFAGSGEFGLPTLRALLESHEVILIVSQPDRPAGRGRHLKPTAVGQFADQHELPMLRTSNINNESLPPADLMVVIAFGQKIAEHQVHHPRLGSVNLHASRLPKYRGAAPINWAIIRGETVTGNSVIRLAPEMDAGPILAQSEVPIGDVETAGELHDRLAQHGAALTLQTVSSGLDTGQAQNESLVTYAPRLTRRDARLDWIQPARDLSNRIRGTWPWPGCHVRLLGADGTEAGRATIIRARPVASEGSRWRPGEIQSTGHITAGERSDFAVEILELQPEGKRAMSLAAYRNGHPWLPGMRMESVI